MSDSSNEQSGICDLCGQSIARGDGYAVWSEGPDPTFTMRVGALLLCAGCGDHLLTHKMWELVDHQIAKKAVESYRALARYEPSTLAEIEPEKYEVFARVGGMQFAKSNAHLLSAALNAKRRGLSLLDARAEAKRIAQLWWTDPEAAGKKLYRHRRKWWWAFGEWWGSVRNRMMNRVAGLRYDGVYKRSPQVAGNVQYSDYLRFYPDGDVIEVCLQGQPKLQVLRESFTKGSRAAYGTFKVEGNRLSFTTVSPRGSIDYEGEIQGDRLVLHLYSHINQHSSTHTYQFVKWRAEQ